MGIKNIAWTAVAVFTWFGIYQFYKVISSVLLS